MGFKPKPWKKQERRKHPRAAVDIPVSFAVLSQDLKNNGGALNHKGICRNLSGGGMALEVAALKEEMLICRNIFKLKITLPFHRASFFCFARLVKAEKNVIGDGYCLRLFFSYIEEDDRRKIIEFVDEKLRLGT